MTKRLDEDSIHCPETLFDKAIRRMEEREAHILNNPASAATAFPPSVTHTLIPDVALNPITSPLNAVAVAMHPYHVSSFN